MLSLADKPSALLLSPFGTEVVRGVAEGMMRAVEMGKTKQFFNQQSCSIVRVETQQHLAARQLEASMTAADEM